MADYSWVDLHFKSQDPKIVEKVEQALEGTNMQVSPPPTSASVDESGEWTCIGAETSYGYADEAEKILQKKKVPYSRYSDGKYEYDGDEAHWEPGMEKPRVFTRLNNGGRVLTEADITAEFPSGEYTDEQLGTFVREHFSFRLKSEEPDEEELTLQFFAKVRAGDPEAVEEAINMLRTHALPEEHPLAID